MISPGGWDIRNILTGPSLALLVLYLAILGLAGVLVFTFRGHVIV